MLLVVLILRQALLLPAYLFWCDYSTCLSLLLWRSHYSGYTCCEISFKCQHNTYNITRYDRCGSFLIDRQRSTGEVAGNLWRKQAERLRLQGLKKFLNISQRPRWLYWGVGQFMMGKMFLSIRPAIWSNTTTEVSTTRVSRTRNLQKCGKRIH